ncbi:MAG: cellobiose phosphorylase [Solirubrobacteraceae bacterium]|nr:cellobiose phosphorylase [Solirubrobacteraceae bacterium]
MGRWRRRLGCAIGGVVALACAAPAAAAGPPPLSADTSRADISSDHGSGVFGTWTQDGLGLPVYRYTIDQQLNPAAAQPELAGKRDAWHQLGNDHIVADAFNHGYVQLWSQDRLYQWANHVEPAGKHYGGGFGWLRTGGKVHSTLYDDRTAGTHPTRDFGVGYLGRRTPADGIAIDERVYAPFGNDPLLLHDVTLRNTTHATKTATWFEYWDVNPYFPGQHSHLGLDAPVYDAAHRTLSVAQQPNAQDPTPMSIFAASLAGPVKGIETDGATFFGTGDRRAPQEVSADKLSGTLAAPTPDAGVGNTLMVFRAPVTIKPGATVTLRYAYGIAHAEKIAPLVARWRKARDPYGVSERRWRGWLPRTDLGAKRRWLSRELQWDAYMVRSGATYEECAGHHIISQGGYYQYDLDFQGAFRDPLQHMLPMIYSDPALARDVILYSAGEQPNGGGPIPYARIARCMRFDLGTSDDLDLWLLLSAAEYGLASRDTKFFDKTVPWADGNGSATLWEHLKAAFSHQESQRGPHGGYISGATGDWSDLSTTFMQMTESMLVSTQTAFIYPRLAELADARGDHAFALQLRSTADGLKKVLRTEWTGKGWFSRGYSGAVQLGKGVIYGEPQPWGLLAGAVDKDKETTLVANIRRFLTGIGAPGGPARIGSSQSPAADDPGVTQTDLGGNNGVGDGHAVYVGGQWFAVDGWLTWALGELDGVVPHARSYALDELERNTLAVRASVYPDHWDGILSVDDACRSWYSTNPAQCGVGLSTAYDTQIMHQPAWSLFDAIKLAGVTPTAGGYRIVPHLPLKAFSLRLPQVGVAARPGVLRGYVRTAEAATLRMAVAPPAGVSAPTAIAYAGGHRVASRVEGGLVVFDLAAASGTAANWALTGPTKGTR